METVSILIPCYNDEEHVGTAIESALNQTWPNCEIIVVDDGSTDRSLTVARKYESDGVRVLTQENKGAPAARNRAFGAASGKYIQYLDADDLLHPRKVEAQVSALQESPPDTVAVCSTVYFQDGNALKEGRRTEGLEEIPWLMSDDPVQWLVNLFSPGGWGMVQTGAWLAPKEVAEEGGPWDEHVTWDQDGEYFTRVLLSSSGVQYVSEGCVYYRKYKNKTRPAQTESREELTGWLRAIDSKRDHLLPLTTAEQHEKATLGIARQYWSLALSAYPEHPDLARSAEARAAELGHPEFLRSVSQNGWKGWVAEAIASTAGWRLARRVQRAYHRSRRTLHALLSEKGVQH